jgi:hypothetical protein
MGFPLLYFPDGMRLVCAIPHPAPSSINGTHYCVLDSTPFNIEYVNIVPFLIPHLCHSFCRVLKVTLPHVQAVVGLPRSFCFLVNIRWLSPYSGVLSWALDQHLNRHDRFFAHTVDWSIALFFALHCPKCIQDVCKLRCVDACNPCALCALRH